MVRAACFYTGDFEPGRRSLQQQKAESEIFVRKTRWLLVKEYMEKAKAKSLKMSLRKTIQTIIEDARADTFDVLIIWGIRCLSYELLESAELFYLLEKAGVSVLLVDMDRMAHHMGGQLLTMHTSKPQPVPDDYYEQFEKKAATKPTKTVGKTSASDGKDEKSGKVTEKPVKSASKPTKPSPKPAKAKTSATKSTTKAAKTSAKPVKSSTSKAPATGNRKGKNT